MPHRSQQKVRWSAIVAVGASILVTLVLCVVAITFDEPYVIESRRTWRLGEGSTNSFDSVRGYRVSKPSTLNRLRQHMENWGFENDGEFLRYEDGEIFLYVCEGCTLLKIESNGQVFGEFALATVQASDSNVIEVTQIRSSSDSSIKLYKVVE